MTHNLGYTRETNHFFIRQVFVEDLETGKLPWVIQVALNAIISVLMREAERNLTHNV